MIEIKNLSFSYNKNQEFMKDINLKVSEGEITTILGPNGSGKSTLLSMLTGINKNFQGQIIVEGENIKNLKQKEIAKKIASLHQHNSVPGDIKVSELVSYGRIPHKSYFSSTTKEDEDIVQWAIKRTGLEKLKDKAVLDLSGGERQRVFLSMALAQKSKILFLDEPTTYLDIYHQIELLELVKELKEREKLTIVMVLHDINQALTYSDNIIVMKKGQVISSGKTKDIINMKLLEEVYNVGGVIEKYNDSLCFIPMKKTID